MSVTINAKGTSVPSFTIGKAGTTIYQGSVDPVGSNTIKAGDYWLDNGTNTLKTRISGVWLAPKLNSLTIPTGVGSANQSIITDGTSGILSFADRVSTVSVVTANGVSGTVATSTTTPAITLTLGAITPTSVAATGTVTGSNLSGTNTGDQSITLTGDVGGGPSTGSITTTLATVNSNTGSFGSATTIPIITVNGKGLITAVSTATISASSATNLSGGTTGALVYQSAANTTAFLAAGTANQVLIGGASAPAWSSSPSGLTSIAATTFTGALTGNATTASALATARNISISGDGTWTVSFSGSGDVTSALTLATVNAAPQTDTFRRTTINAKGLVTATSPVVAGDITTALTFTPVNKNGDTMTGLLVLSADPSANLGAATKQYVDNIAAGLSAKNSCNTATTATLAVSSAGTITYNNGTAGVGATLTTTGTFNTIGGFTTANGNRILVKDEVTQVNNGIYTRTSATVLTRATDFDNNPPGEIEGGDFTFISSGTLAGTNWVQVTPAPITVGTTIIVFTQLSGPGTFAAGSGISITGNVIANTGVLSNIAGTGISVSGATGNVTIGNTGVTQITGTANQITASASTGSITLSLPSAVTISGIMTASSFTGAGTGLTGTASSLSIGGNAASATVLQNARLINGTSFNGSADITITAANPNALTMNNGGAGAASGTTYTGASAQTISYNTIGASPTAGSSSITTVGTVTTGTWNAGIIAGQYGGTGVANTGKTITLGNNLTTVGNFTTSLTVTGTTAITLPTTGTIYSGSGAPVTGGVIYGSSATQYASTAAGTTSQVLIGGASAPAFTSTPSGLTSVSATTFTGALTGNASSASVLSPGRNINGVLFNGSTDITISAGSVTNALTMNNSGTGAASGSTFNGSAAVTLSYNTLGASPLAGSSSLTTVGTITSGTWNAGAVTSTGLITGAGYRSTGNNNIDIVATGYASNQPARGLRLLGGPTPQWVSSFTLESDASGVPSTWLNVTSDDSGNVTKAIGLIRNYTAFNIIGVEKMRLHSDGALLVNQTTSDGVSKIQVTGSGTSSANPILVINQSTNRLWFNAKAASGWNSLIQANDEVVLSQGPSVDTGRLFLGTWSGNATGVRITATNVDLSASSQVTAPTPPPGTSNTQVATTAFVRTTSGVFTVGPPPAPSSPTQGDRWLSTDSGRIYTYFNDGDSSQWAEFAGDAGIVANGVTIPVINPPTPKEGDYRIVGGVLSFWIAGAWVQSIPAIYA